MEHQSFTLNDIAQELHIIKGMIISMQKENNKSVIKLEDELWTVQMVADYLHKSKGTIQSHYQGKSGFPRSKRIGNAQYWKPLEIIAYANKREIH